jgi:GAF domain-containing protein/HAMP domain-containing protein
MAAAMTMAMATAMAGTAERRLAMTAAILSPQLETPAMIQSARRSILLMLAGLGAIDGFAWYLAITAGDWQLFALAGALLLFALVSAAGLLILRGGRAQLGVWLAFAAFILASLATGALVNGLGVVLGLVVPILGIVTVAQSLPRWQAVLAALITLAAGLGVWLGDSVAGNPLVYRIAAPGLAVAIPVVAGLVVVVQALFLARALADLSLRAKLIVAFLVVTLVPLGALAAVDYRASQRALTDAANQALLGAAGQAAESIETFFFNVRYTVLAESQFPTVSEYLTQPAAARAGSQLERDLTGIMQNWVLRDKRANAYLLLDNRGVVAISTSPDDAGQDLSQMSLFQQAMGTGDTRVSDVLFLPNSSVGEIDVSVAVRDENLRFVGVLVARFSKRILEDFVSQTNGLAGINSYGVLFDENMQELADGADLNAIGKFVAQPDPANLARLESLGRVPQLPAGAAYSLNRPDLARELTALVSDPRTANQFFTVQGAPGEGLNQVAVTRLYTKPWLLAFFEPRDVFLAPVQSQTSTTLTLAALIAVIVTAGALLAAQLLADPLTRLTSTAERVATGDLTVRAQVQSRDEIGTLASTFNTMTGRLSEMLATLESRVSERTTQLQAAADIARATASVRSLDELLRLALDLIRDRFGFYHASIFLIDEDSRAAVLRESTGPVGAQLKARGHKLGIGSQSLIGWVTANRKPRVALDVADDPFHFKNPLLPDTRSELAIPLIVGDRLVGALDVQSTQADAFAAGDVQVLQTLADQLSVAIENAELFQRTQANLNELSKLYQRLTGSSWRSFLHGEKREAIYETGTSDATETLIPAGKPLELALQLRDRTVGVIEIYGRPAEAWSDEEKAALGTVAAQVSAALETAALLEESQRRRVREQVINDITYQMRATLNPTSVVQSGIRELGRALGATEVVVRLTQERPAQGAAAPEAGAQEGQP